MSTPDDPTDNTSGTESPDSGQSLLSKVAGFLGSSPRYPPAQLDGSAYEQATEALTDVESSECTLLAVRPPVEHDGIRAAARLYESGDFHDVRLGMFKRQQSPQLAHEIRYEDGKIVFYYAAPSRVKANDIMSKIEADYENVDVSRAGSMFPTFQEGEYVSAARVHLTKPFYYPIKSPLTAAVDDDPVSDRDPYRDLLTDMVVQQEQTDDGTVISADDCRVLVQTVFEPARDIWSQGSRFGMDVKEVSRNVKQGELKTSLIGEEKAWRADATSQDKKAAKIIEKQRGENGYYVTLRVLAFSPYPEIAQRRVRQIASDYSKYYETSTEQGLSAESVSPGEIPNLLIDTIQRNHEVGLTDRLTQLNQTKFLLSRQELASICHLPDEEVNVPEVDHATMETGPGVPADAPQMDDLMNDDDTDDGSRTRTINPEGTTPTATEDSNSSGTATPNSQAPAEQPADQPASPGPNNPLGDAAPSGTESPSSRGSDARDPAAPDDPDGHPQPEADGRDEPLFGGGATDTTDSSDTTVPEPGDGNASDVDDGMAGDDSADSEGSEESAESAESEEAPTRYGRRGGPGDIDEYSGYDNGAGQTPATGGGLVGRLKRLFGG